MHYMVCLERFIREVFTKKKQVATLFFDLGMAYESTWEYGTIRDLHELELKIGLQEYINNFLSNRTCHVRIESILSDPKPKEGEPQGRLLPVTLFSIKINKIPKYLSQAINVSLYVGCFTVRHRPRNMHTTERKLHQCINIRWVEK